MIKNSLLSIAVILPLGLNAEIISYNGYALDTETNIVTGGGLEWLQWDETSRYSISRALSEYSGLGWILASDHQMVDLYNDFGFGAVRPWIVDDENQQVAYEPYVNTDTTTADYFQSLFGASSTQKETGGYGAGEDGFSMVWAFYGSDANENQRYNSASIYSAMTIRNNTGSPDYQFYGPYITREAKSFLNPETVNAYSSGVGGVALVREINTVPIPAGIWLFLSALLGLASLKFKIENKLT